MFLFSILVLYTFVYINGKEHSELPSIISIVNQGSSNTIFKIIPGATPKYVVQSKFKDNVNSTGWGHLTVRSSSNYPDEIQAYFSGVAEGLSTKTLIDYHWYNTYQNFCDDKSYLCGQLQSYLSDNLESMIVKSRNQGGFWKMVRLMLWQIKGLQDAFDNKYLLNSTQINENYLRTLKQQVLQLYLLQADGDLAALSNILGVYDQLSNTMFPTKKVIGDGSCSAFFKYVPHKGVYAAHVTWSPYANMLRITKHYDFPYSLKPNNNGTNIIAGSKISFSSYPGIITSIDDFYVTSGGLVTIETTNGNYNYSLYKGLDKQANNIVLEYFRVQVANRIADNGIDWIKYFSLYNSGTYNNQWMILNNNLLKNHSPGQNLPDKLLYVAEQIPTLIVSEDVTDYLRKSFWSSYNIPYNTTIYNKSGFQDMAKHYGDFFTHDKAPRAKIFKRDGHSVVGDVSLMKLMRYNNFKNDPLARCTCDPPYSAENGISARCDLNKRDGTYPIEALGYRLHGGTDLKFTYLDLANKLSFVAISGPTYDQQPVFEWAKIDDPKPRHRGHPGRFKFPPIIVPVY